MSEGIVKRLMPPESAAGRLVRSLGRKVAPSLPEGLRWRLGLPIQMTFEIKPLLKLCRAEVSDQAHDWDWVLAVARRHGGDDLADILQGISGKSALRINELKLLTSFMALQGTDPQAQRRYEALLNGHDPDLRLPEGVRGEGFTGRGVGTGSLNAYRQVRLNGTMLFEKVYINSHWEVAHMRYAQAHILPRLKTPRSPALVHLVQGSRLTVAYFEWADIPERQQRTLGSAVTLVRQLQTLDPAEMPPPPPTMTDFAVGQMERLLESVPRDLAAMFPDHSPPLELALPRWRERVAGLPKGFCHGDPSIGNVLPNGWVLDWDNCGLFPLGHDAAHYLALRHRRVGWDRIRELFEARFLDPRAPEASWQSFLFFYIHFLMKVERRNESLLPSALAELTRVMEPG